LYAMGEQAKVMLFFSTVSISYEHFNQLICSFIRN